MMFYNMDFIKMRHFTRQYYWLLFICAGFGILSLLDPLQRIKDNALHLQQEVDTVNHTQTQGSIPTIAVLIFVCNRPTVVKCLDRILKYRPSVTQFPIILSQDCGRHNETLEALQQYEDKFLHIFQPHLSVRDGYEMIARHYKWGLNYVFNRLNYTNVIIVEDDLEIAPDFFEYFEATLPLLKTDPSLWCVSAWNDNGMTSRINMATPELLYRTDFLPGLGWMMTSDLWQELSPKWPRIYWDDWMRNNDQRKNRSCIRPEISRTRNFGKVGVSRGQNFDSHLRYIELNTQFVPFSRLDLSYLIKENYDGIFLANVNSAQLIDSIEDITDRPPDNTEYKITYASKMDYEQVTQSLHIMEDIREGVPRMAYLGVVPTIFDGHRLYITPANGFS